MNPDRITLEWWHAILCVNYFEVLSQAHHLHGEMIVATMNKTSKQEEGCQILISEDGFCL
jgi:hypothetical protein